MDHEEKEEFYVRAPLRRLRRQGGFHERASEAFFYEDTF